MPRSRIDGLLASFPKLMTTGSQHTTIETPDVRYVYQPLEDLYLLIITTKSSNILQVRSFLSSPPTQTVSGRYTRSSTEMERMLGWKDSRHRAGRTVWAEGLSLLQDISTLSLLVRCVADLLRSSVDEPTIVHHAFDLIAAFDEIVSLGFRENVTVQQVRSVLEAESHEEKIQEIIARVSRALSFLVIFIQLIEFFLHLFRRTKRPRSRKR